MFQPQHVDVSLSQGVTIHWSDGHVSHYEIRRLRQACPCATCQDLHGTGAAAQAGASGAGTSGAAAGPAPKNPLPMYQPVGATLLKVEPVGRYALQFFFSDRHSTGIYTWEYLRELCPCPECTAARRQ